MDRNLALMLGICAYLTLFFVGLALLSTNAMIIFGISVILPIFAVLVVGAYIQVHEDRHV